MALCFGCLRQIRPALAFKEDNFYMGFFCSNSPLLCFCVTPLLRRGFLEAHGIFMWLTDAPQDVSSRYHTRAKPSVGTSVANLSALTWGPWSKKEMNDHI